MTHFGQPWSSFGQTLVKNPLNTLWPSYVIHNFCRVLQILPKHFKFSQYESCVVFRGTQLSCWVAFEIWSVNGWKTVINFGTVQRRHENSQVGMHFVHKWLRKTPYRLSGPLPLRHVPHTHRPSRTDLCRPANWVAAVLRCTSSSLCTHTVTMSTTWRARTTLLARLPI
jgi:hypothetical protein